MQHVLFDDLKAASNLRLRAGEQGAFPSSGCSYSKSRVVTFGIKADDQFTPPIAYSNASDLQAHLQCCDKPSRSIYLLEGLAPDFTSAIYKHFRPHPSVFSEHHRLVAFSKRATGESGGLPCLPSSIQGRQHISLKYHEALTICPRPTGFRNICQTTGRHLMASRTSDRFSEVLIARRKCTVWSRKTERGGWDCMCLLLGSIIWPC
jgi:hypothetical protein